VAGTTIYAAMSCEDSLPHHGLGIWRSFGMDLSLLDVAGIFKVFAWVGHRCVCVWLFYGQSVANSRNLDSRLNPFISDWQSWFPDMGTGIADLASGMWITHLWPSNVPPSPGTTHWCGLSWSGWAAVADAVAIGIKSVAM